MLGSEGRRVYAANGVGITLTASGGGGSSETELSALAGLADTCTFEEGVWRFSLRIGKAGEQA